MMKPFQDPDIEYFELFTMQNDGIMTVSNGLGGNETPWG